VPFHAALISVTERKQHKHKATRDLHRNQLAKIPAARKHDAEHYWNITIFAGVRDFTVALL
jgi:hypothetical protein